MDQFTKAYINCALWSSTDESGIPLDNNYTVEDIAPETLEKMKKDCADFQEIHGHQLGDKVTEGGHDFWLTRNGHGAGFWDGDWPNYGEELTKASHSYGPFDLCVVDSQNLIHGYPL